MTARLLLELDLRPLYRVCADVLVVPYVKSHGLGRGPLAWADWRLCGLLSETLRRSEGDGSDTVLLAPTGGRLRAGWVMVLGLAEGTSEEGLRSAAEQLLERVRSLNVSRLALALPAGGDPARVSEALAVGLMAGLARRSGTLVVRLVVPGEAAHYAWAGLERAARAPLPGVELRLRAPAEPRLSGADRPADLVVQGPPLGPR